MCDASVIACMHASATSGIESLMFWYSCTQVFRAVRDTPTFFATAARLPQSWYSITARSLSSRVNVFLFVALLPIIFALFFTPLPIVFQLKARDDFLLTPFDFFTLSFECKDSRCGPMEDATLTSCVVFSF